MKFILKLGINIQERWEKFFRRGSHLGLKRIIAMGMELMVGIPLNLEMDP
jgi:hypothetical protein